MNSKDFIQSIKDIKQPYHLSDTEEHKENIYSDIINFKLPFQLSSKDPLFKKRQKQFFDSSRIFDNSTTPFFDTSINDFSSKQGNSKHHQFGFFVNEIFQQEYKREEHRTRKIKCASLERIALEELQIFYRYNYSSKCIKKIV